MTTVSYDGARICLAKIPEQLGEGNRWPRSDITWQLDAQLPGIERDALRGAIQAAGESWQRVCGVRWFEGQGSRANILITTQRERPGGVLADCELPYPGMSADATLRLRIDEADAWAIADNPPPNRVGLVQVLAHEIGHGLGLGHGPQGALMQPTYSPRLWAPQAWDIVEARLRYQLPRESEPTPDPVPTLGRRRFDGRLLREIAKQFPGLVGVIGDPAKIPDIIDLPDGLDGLFGADGIELLSVRAGAGGLSVRVLGKVIPLGAR